MKIANIMLAAGYGGITIVLFKYSEMLVGEGHEVLNVVRKNSTAFKELSSKKNRSKLLAIPSVTGLFGLFSVFKLRKFLKKYKPDVVICHNYRRRILWATKRIAPVVVVTHNYNMKLLNKFDGIFVLTEDLKNNVINAGIKNKKLYVIPNVIDKKIPVSLEKRSDNFIPYIGAIGRFVPVKGFEFFIKALDVLKRKGIKFKAFLAGSGRLEKDLKNLAKGYGLTEKEFVFEGLLEEKSVSSFYKKLDIMCVPSNKEAFGLVVLEGFLYGAPVIGADAGGVASIIDDGKNGLLFPVGDYVKLADCIERLILDVRLREELRQNALKTLQQKYSMKIIAEKMCRALADIVNKN